jgi:hypothetical protein
MDGKLDQLLLRMDKQDTRIGEAEVRINVLESDKDKRWGMGRIVVMIGAAVGIVSGTVVNKVWDAVVPPTAIITIGAPPK